MPMLKELASLVPRPLRILVIIVVVLGVVSCGLGLARGRESDPNAKPSAAQQRTAGSLPLLAPPRVRAEQLIGCDAQDGTIALSASSCTLTVPQAGLRPAKLVLDASGSATVTVTQVVEGRSFTESSSTSPFEVTTSRSGPTTLSISCSVGCSLTVRQ